MKRSEQMRVIEDKIAALKDLSYDAIKATIAKQPDLKQLEKVAVLMESELKSFNKTVDKVEEFTKANAEYWLSSAAMYAVKNYAFNYGKMFAPEIGVAVGAIVGFQLLMNPDFVFGTIGSVWSGLTHTIGNYTNYVVDAVKPNATVLATSIDITKNATLSTPINKSNTVIADEAVILKQEPLNKYLDMAVKVNMTEPTYIVHEGLHFLVTPFSMVDHSI